MKKLAVILFLFFANLFENSAQSWMWAKCSASAGGGIGDEGFSVCADANGNSFITGAFTSPALTLGSYVLSNTGQQNFYVAKYSPAGNVLWAKSATGSGGDHGNAVIANSAGDIYVTGYFTSPTMVLGSFTLTNSGGANVFVVKYDANGNVLWARSSTGTGDNEAQSISIDPNGNIYITGFFGGPTLAFGGYTLTNTANPGNYNAFLVKYNAAGNVLWAKCSNGTGVNLGFSVSADNAGNAFITGSYRNAPIVFGSYTLTNTGATGNQNIFLSKYDPNGNVLWAKTSYAMSGGYNIQSVGNSVCNDISGNAYITGYFDTPSISFGTYTVVNTGTYNVFFVKYNSAGSEQWVKSFKGEGKGYALCSDANHIYMSGAISNYPVYTIVIDNYTLTAPPSSPDPSFIARFNLNGNATYATYLTSGSDDRNSIYADKNCNLFVGGDTQDATGMVVGTTTLNYTGVEDVFIAKFSTPQPTISALSSGSLICAGQSVTLSASGASGYTWNPGGQGAIIVATPSTTTVYTLTGTDSITGCNNTTYITQSVTACDYVKTQLNPVRLTVFPNPNNGGFKIQADFQIEKGEFILSNSAGVMVHKQKIVRGLNNIITAGLPAGIYYYTIFDGIQQVAADKIIIE